MQASLVDVLLYIIRDQALNGYLPLGALAGAAQAPQLSYLWSLEFFSALVAPSRAFKLRQKFIFVSSTSALLFMTAVVGPSSAILMISQPGMTHVQNTTIRYLNVSEVDLFPIHIDKTNHFNVSQDVDLSKIAGLDYKHDSNGPTRRKGIWPNDFYNTNIQRVIQQIEYPTFHSEAGGNWTIATLPTMLSAKQLWHYSSVDPGNTVERETLLSAGAHWTLQTAQPVVVSACSPISYHTDNISYFRVNGSTSILQNATELYDTMLKIDADRGVLMSWIQMPQDSTSLLALFRYNESRQGLGNGILSEPKDFFTVCTVSSFWWDTSTSLSLTSTANLIQTDWPGSIRDIVQDKLRPIIIDPEGIDTLYILDYISLTLDGSQISATIVEAFAAALSWVPGRDANPFYKSIAEDMFEGKNSSSIQHSSSSTSFRIVRKITGYGYGGTGTSTQLSLAVIVAYCFITITYVTYIVVTGHTSVAWDSATELIMLALQSKEPNDLGHVSVGIDSMETLRRSVGIRVNTVNVADTGEHMQKLELVFEHAIEDKRRMLKKVERNQAY